MPDGCKHSRFWLDEKQTFPIDLSDDVELLRLASLRRSIANFVYILTRKNIPVKFSAGKKSFTDGTEVTIGSSLAAGDVDETVGLALHEAMHIVESDFKLLKLLWQKIPRSLFDAAKGKMNSSQLADFCKLILNIVEDRFIDAAAYKRNPGYRGYYDALYLKHFLSPRVTRILMSKKLREPSVIAYKIRVLGLVNPVSDLTALPGLEEISDILDLPNILRLKTMKDRMELSFKIVSIILEHLPREEKNEGKQEKKSDDSNEKSDDSSDASNGDNSDSDCDEDDDGGSSDSDVESESNEPSTEDEQSSDEGASESDEPSDEEIKQVAREQEDFTNGNVETAGFDQEVLNRLDDMVQADVDVVEVGGNGVPRVDCIVVKKMTESLMESEFFPYTVKITSTDAIFCSEAVQDGLRYGRLIGTKLQIRNDAKTTKFTRQDHGKFDRRIVSELGWGNENVFYRTSIEKFKRAHLHLSVDASSSMEGCWKKTMKVLVAIATAGSMVNNLDVVISFRSGVRRETIERPYILIAYDSRVDKLSKIKTMFHRMIPRGSTPEGLTFEAILDMIPPSTEELDSYFVNISDGAPSFSDYAGDKAAQHTRKQIDKMRNRGVNVLSYFISGTDIESTRKWFTQMYGPDETFINVENLLDICKTLNRLFLQKT